VSEPNVLIERHGRVGLAILNRPATLNALNAPLTDELEAAIQQFDADDEIGAIVITGAGERAFSSGGDMKEQRQALADGTILQRRSASSVVRVAQKPTIAAIRGYAFGGGALLAINCDIRILGTDARMKFHGATYGQAPGGAALPRIVGAAKAMEILFTGDEINAEEAHRIGLANQVVAPEAVLETALAMAARIAANSPKAVPVIKRAIDLATSTEAAQAYEDQANSEIRTSADSAARFRQAAEKVVGPA
jgi:enoyl-CoA hydratase/carnithine racemase